MILRVWSDLPTFHEARFDRVGMNVVLANRGEDSKETESTNGLGKTTLLRIIHFVLGADLPQDKVLSHPDLVGVTFGMDLEIDGETAVISRNTGSPKKVSVTRGFLAGLSLDYESVGGDVAVVDLDSWRCALSARLAPEAKLSEQPLAFSPTFRELVYYFIRIGKAALADPQVAYSNQAGASKRLVTSFLLGLNWPIQRELHNRLDERQRLNSALKVLREAAESADEKSIGDLEAGRVVLETALASRRKEIAAFNLRADYHELEDNLSSADRRLHDLINENYSDRRLLRYYEESAQEAPLFDSNRPVAILRDAGAVFQPQTLRTLDDVVDFHRQLYQNRAEFLAAEVSRLRRQVAERDLKIDAASNEKSDLLRVLSASGALETLIELQRTATNLGAELEALKARIEERKRFDRRKDEVTAEIGHIRTLLKQDLDDRRELLDEAIGLFAEYTQALYGVPGKLSVDVQDNGYRFTFSIDRQGSDGVDQMVVFCFDLMVATLRARRNSKFLSLVHDSGLFADVDPRQYGLALQLAAKTSAVEGFQYVCCLNIGALPQGHLGDLDLVSDAKLRLSDDGDAGRLLGLRLPPRESK